MSQKLTTPSEPNDNMEVEVDLGTRRADNDSDSLEKLAYRMYSAFRGQDEKPCRSPSKQAIDPSHLNSGHYGGI